MAGSIQDSNLFAIATVTATETLHKTIFPSQTTTPFIFALTTSIPIFVQPSPLSTPFNPEYELFRDGSLITPLFVNDFVQDKMRLILIGVFGMLFLRNLCIAVHYTIRVQIKHKMLFYFLICSQFCALPTVAALMAPFFVEFARCNITIIVAAIFVNLSVTFLIPGIMGIKVYRFLGRPRIVPAILGIVHTSSLVLFFSDLPNLVYTRKLTGSCLTQGNIPRMVVGIALILFEIVFICVCFAYAVWRAARYPEARGRTSIRLSLDPETIETGDGWDFLTNQQADASNSNDRMNGRESRQLCNKRPSRVMRLIMMLFGDRDLIEAPHYMPRKPSTPGLEPILLSGKRRRSWRDFPRMFRIPDALKNELMYTTIVAVTCAISNTLVVAGLFDERLMGGPLAWVGLSWSATSIVILHNFSRLVRRNERDRILQEPAAWNPMLVPPVMTQPNRPFVRSSERSVSFLQSVPQSQNSTLSCAPDLGEGPSAEKVRIGEDPFADFEIVDSSWNRRSTLSWKSQDKLLVGLPNGKLVAKSSKYS